MPSNVNTQSESKRYPDQQDSAMISDVQSCAQPDQRAGTSLHVQTESESPAHNLPDREAAEGDSRKRVNSTRATSKFRAKDGLEKASWTVVSNALHASAGVLLTADTTSSGQNNGHTKAFEGYHMSAKLLKFLIDKKLISHPFKSQEKLRALNSAGPRRRPRALGSSFQATHFDESRVTGSECAESCMDEEEDPTYRPTEQQIADIMSDYTTGMQALADLQYAETYTHLSTLVTQGTGLQDIGTEISDDLFADNGIQIESTPVLHTQCLACSSIDSAKVFQEPMTENVSQDYIPDSMIDTTQWDLSCSSKSDDRSAKSGEYPQKGEDQMKMEITQDPPSGSESPAEMFPLKGDGDDWMLAYIRFE